MVPGPSCFVAGLSLVPACAADADPGGLDPSDQDGVLPEDGDGDGDGALTALAQVRRAGCDDLSAEYRLISASRDGAAIERPSCAWIFDDGATAEGCSGIHTFGATGILGGTVIVTDPDTGDSVAVDAEPDHMFEPLELEIALEVPPCGLSLGYAVSLTGGQEGGQAITHITPANRVVGHEPVAQAQLVEVTEAGFYVVQASAEADTATFTCAAHAAETVIVLACGEPCPEHGVVHEHESPGE